MTRGVAQSASRFDHRRPADPPRHSPRRRCSEAGRTPRTGPACRYGPGRGRLRLRSRRSAEAAAVDGPSVDPAEVETTSVAVGTGDLVGDELAVADRRVGSVGYPDPGAVAQRGVLPDDAVGHRERGPARDTDPPTLRVERRGDAVTDGEAVEPDVVPRDAQMRCDPDCGVWCSLHHRSP